jgi:hypothetical protein
VKTLTITDRRGRKYDLHLAVLTEHSTRWAPERYAILRKDLGIAFLQANGAMVPTLVRDVNKPEHFRVTVWSNGRVRIGCRLFFSEAGRTLVRWACA